MKEEKIFVYGTLMNRFTLENVSHGNVKVLECVPAFIEGKLYDGGAFPIVIPKNVGRKARAPIIVHGALLTVLINQEGLEKLDAYEGCSKSRLGKNSSSDLYHRIITKVYKVHYKSIGDFINLNYSVEDETINAYTYIGNIENEFVRRICMHLRRKNGLVWRTYFNIFG